MENKKCSKCGNEYPLTEEFFFRRRKTKWVSCCKVCCGNKFGVFRKPDRDGFHVCYKCKIELPADNEHFHKDSRSKSGLSSLCKECDRARGKEYYYNNTEKVLDRTGNYKVLNKERDKPIVNAGARRRRSININIRIAESLRSNMRHALFGKGKSASTIKLLGCSIKFFRKYIEDRFKDGMTWRNYSNKAGCWSFDHIRSCASFDDLSDPDQQRECFHYTNIQPMWHLENVRKSSWYNGILHRYKKPLSK